MWLKFVLMLIGAYLLGSIPAAYLGVKWFKGTDIRKLGTGVAGSSNVARTTSKTLAVPVALFDMGKGALAVWIAQLLGLSVAQQVAVGILAIAGHDWPIFIGFRGGKGMITSLGVIMMFSPLLGLIVAFMAAIVMPIRQMALGVFVGLISLPLFSWFLYQPLGIDLDSRLPVTVGVALIAVMGFFKRLVVHRVDISRSMPLPQVLLYRLLFDRDIRNRKAWIDRKPEKPA